MPVVTPERWYQLFWIVFFIVLLYVTRIFLVNPVIRAIKDTKCKRD